MVARKPWVISGDGKIDLGFLVPVSKPGWWLRFLAIDASSNHFPDENQEMDRSRRTSRSTYGGSVAGGRGPTTPTARGRGRATPTARGRGRVTPTARGRGPTIPTGRGRGGISSTAHDDTLDQEPSVEPVDTTTPVDPITQVIANSVAPTTTIDPTAAYQAIQTLVGLFTGQQVQAGPVDASRSMTLDKGTVLDRFLKTTPPSFMGSDKPSDAEAWLLRMEKIFDILGCSETQKVSLATYKLEGDAEHWWRMAKQKYKGKEHELIWSAFKKDFEDKYIPPAVKNQKRTEFLKLEQGNMSVAEYQRKFDELSRFAGKLVEKEEDKVWHFLRGLRPDIRGRVSLLDSETLSQLVTKALTAEKDIAEEKGAENQYKRYRSGQSSGSGYPAKRVQTLSQTNEGVREASRPCFKCGKPHAAAFRCDGSPRICFNCGQAGHISTYCRAQVGGRNQAPQGQRLPARGGGYNLRQSNNQGNYKQQTRNGGQGQRNVTEGRVYALTQQQAKDAPSVVQGKSSR